MKGDRQGDDISSIQEVIRSAREMPRWVTRCVVVESRKSKISLQINQTLLSLSFVPFALGKTKMGLWGYGMILFSFYQTHCDLIGNDRGNSFRN